MTIRRFSTIVAITVITAMPLSALAQTYVGPTATPPGNNPNGPLWLSPGSAQNGYANLTANTGINLYLGGDISAANGKAIRSDLNSGSSALNLGNWGTTPAGYELDVFGNLVIKDNDKVSPYSGILAVPQICLNNTGSLSTNCITTWPSGGSGTIGGSGTANYIPVFSAGTSIGNSIVYQSGSNIGIGTVTPGARLSVVGAATDPSTYDDGKGMFVSANTGGANVSIAEFRHDNLSQGVGIGYASVFATGANASQNLEIFSRGTAPLVLNASGGGNVGIKTADPSMAGTYDALALSRGAGGIYGLTTNVTGQWYLSLATEGANRLNVMDNGNVGIGTTGPADRLEVNGNLRFTGANPYINAASYFIAPGGAYFNSGTVYTEATIQARGGIHNDTGTNLVLAGGTSNNTYVSGSLGVGTASPGVKVDVVGDAGVTAIRGTASTASGYGVTGINNAGSGGGTGVYGSCSGGNCSGVQGVTSGGGSGVSGSGTTGVSGSGSTGVYGYGSSNGVYGLTNSPSGNGVYGVASGGGNNAAGVVGTSDGPAGIGVYGGGSGSNSTGVYGNGIVSGVNGHAPATGIGVWGTGGTGGEFDNLNTPSNYARIGTSNSGVTANGSTFGVSGTGVYGVYGSGNPYGVYGTAQYGVYGSGSLDGVIGNGGNIGGNFSGTSYGIVTAGPIGINSNGTSYSFYGNSGTLYNAGYVGIGTTGPAYSLDVNGDSIQNWMRTRGNTGWYNETYAGGWYMTDASWVRSYNSKNVYTGSGVLASDGGLGIGTGGGTAGAGTGWFTGRVYTGNTNQYVGPGRNNDMSFINNSGGTWTRYSGTNGLAFWSIGGGDANDSPQMFLNTGGSLNTTAGYTQGSDRDLKTDIAKLTKYGIDDIMKLEPVTFEYKADTTKTPQLGFIAQDLQKVMPEFVTGKAISDGGTGLGVNYSTMVSVLTRGMQDQQKEIQDLKTQNDELLKRLEALEAKVK